MSLPVTDKWVSTSRNLPLCTMGKDSRKFIYHRDAHYRVEWTNKKLDNWNPTLTKSCLMVGTCTQNKLWNFFLKYYCLLPSTESQSLKKYIFVLEKCLFYCSTWLPCNIALERTLWTEENDISFVKICFYLVKLLPFKHFPCFTTCREDKNR